MIEMARQDIYPAVNGYLAELCGSIASKRAVSEKMPVSEDVKLAEKLATMNDAMMAAVAKLERDLSEMPEGEQPASQKMAHVVLPDSEIARCASLPTAWKSCARPTTALSHLHGYSVQRKIMAEGEPCAPVCARAFPLERTIFL